MKARDQIQHNRLASIVADSVGAAQCISTKKYPDGMFNKAFLMTMEDGREVVAKVPNPDAGIPHFTAASEAVKSPRRILYVHSEGVPLSQVWGMMRLPSSSKCFLP